MMGPRHMQRLWDTVLALQSDNRCLDHVTGFILHPFLVSIGHKCTALCWVLYSLHGGEPRSLS